MYNAFFGFSDSPFNLSPDPAFLYRSQQHEEALANLVYGVQSRKGFIVLTGEVGTGKTTVVRSLLAQTPKDAEIALILNPRITAPEFLLTICEELGIGVPDSATQSVKDLVDILNDYLLQAHARGRRVVLVVDEAQNLATDVLEQVRLLTNLETSTQKLLQIILIGQPELRELLARNELRQLAQRITGRFHLDPLSRSEAAAYVRHRLRVAGSTSDIFTAAALREIYRLSGGVPRVINVICDRALLGAYTQDRHHVSAAIVRRASAEVLGRHVPPPWLPWAMTAAATLVVLLGGLAIYRFAPWRSNAQAAALAAPQSGAGAGKPEKAEGAAKPGLADAAKAGAAGATPAMDSSATEASLSALLAAHPDATDVDHAFSTLFGLWKASYVPDKTDPCSQAARQGLECLVERGSFGQLRLYNRPAILVLSDERGSHQVVLSQLGESDARIELAGASHQVPIADLSRYWLGDFVILWQPGAQAVKDLSFGMRDDSVPWLRHSLQKLRGLPASQSSSSTLFDADLSKMVMDFQREHRLTIDGIAGVQTQVILSSAVPKPDSPLLVSNMAHGS